MSTLLVLLKYPRGGQVKTRLAASVGAERASTLYREWIGHVLCRIQPLRECIRIVAYYDGAPRSEFAAWSLLADEWWPQPAGDLGTRLTIGFERAHRHDPPVVAIGTDCLDVDAPLVSRAFAELASRDVVFGPASDGGYYLVGTSRAFPGFFCGIPWSTPETLCVHRIWCRQNGWKAADLPTLRDIDTMDDWLRHNTRDVRS